MSERGKYNTAKTILFPLIDFGATDFESTPVTFAAGDVKIIKDEGAAANTSNLPAHEGNGIYSLALTATEMQAARIAITVIDQTATKLWEDQVVLIETYGNASAEHEFDLDAPAASIAALADAVLDEIASGHATAGSVGAILTGLNVTGRTNNPTLDALLGVPDSAGADVPSAVATDVWDRTKSSHVSAGTMGLELQQWTQLIANTKPADGTRPTPAQALLAIYRFLFERDYDSGTMTLTVYEEDGVSIFMKFTTDSGASPTNITRTT